MTESETSPAETRWVKGDDGRWHEELIEADPREPALQEPLQGPPEELHGHCFGFERDRAGWAPPSRTFASAAAARPGYESMDASEFADEDGVLRAKVAALAALCVRSACTVVYAGAGLSTAAGIDDYATQGRAAAAGALRSPLCAQPTLAHRVLVGLHQAGHLHRLVQQNHDGLPQKAGLPQAAVNEIHGALHAPDNPVIPMGGSLRADLYEDLLDCEARAELVLAVGTSLAGMNADRIVQACADRACAARGRGPPGAVIIGLQRTRLDSVATLRIFGTCDRVFELLAAALALGARVPPALPAGRFFRPAVLRRHEAVADGSAGEDYLLPGVAYDAMGRRGTAATTLDLREGAAVLIPTGLHAGAAGEVEGTDREGHVRVRFLLRLKTGSGFRAPMAMVVGSWWLQGAWDASVAQLPVVSPPSDADGSEAAAELRALREAYG